MKFHRISQNLTQFHSITRYKYFDLVQYGCISLTFYILSKVHRKIFCLVLAGSKFPSFGLGNGES
jgi:hypothetical protein